MVEPLATPNSVQIRDSGPGGSEIRVRILGRAGRIFIAVALVWWLSLAIVVLLAPRVPPAIGLHVVLGLGIAVAAVLSLNNGFVLQLSGSGVVVRQQLGLARRIEERFDFDELARFVVAKNVEINQEVGRWGVRGVERRTHEVHVELRSGEQLPLVRAIDRPDVAAFLVAFLNSSAGFRRDA